MNSGNVTWVLLTCAALVVFGCDSEKQGTSKHSDFPERMQIVENISRLTASDHRNTTYRYELIGGCQLLITKLLNGSRFSQANIDLSNTDFEIFEYAKGLGYSLRTPGSHGKLTIFETPSPERVETAIHEFNELSSMCRTKQPLATR